MYALYHTARHCKMSKDSVCLTAPDYGRVFVHFFDTTEYELHRYQLTREELVMYEYIVYHTRRSRLIAGCCDRKE